MTTATKTHTKTKTATKNDTDRRQAPRSDTAAQRGGDPYPSRVERQPRILPRQDPVVHTPPDSGSAPSGLRPRELERYERDGFLLLPGFFDATRVAELQEELHRLAASDQVKAADEAITEPDSGVVRSLFRVHRFSEVFDALARDSRLLTIAQYLLADDVYLHQSRVNLKPGFAGKEFYWHSDFETWHVEDGMPRMRAVSMSIALTENFAFNGPLMLIPGSHQHYIACVGETPEDNYKQSLRRQEIGVPDNESLSTIAERGGIETAKGPAGSVALFDCNTMHGSNSNITPFPRSNVFFVYNSCANRLQAPYGPATARPNFLGERELTAPLISV